MRTEQISGKEERRILTGMVVDLTVCGRISTKWEPDLFRSKWANIVGEMCVKHVKKYGKAPGKAIEGLFDAWASEQKDKETVSLVEKFLGSLSDEYEAQAKETNAPYLLDLAGRYFTRIRLQRLFERGMGFLDAGQLDKAEQSVTLFGKVEMGKGTSIDVVNDDDALQRAFAERAEPLFTLPGDIGRFFGRSLCREGFISLLAPEKRGKTAWLVWLAIQAVKQRKKVVFFSCGDESEEEMMLRFAVHLARHPLDLEFPVMIPTELTVEDGEPHVARKRVRFERPLAHGKARAKFDEFKQETLRSKKEWLKLSVHANSTLSVEDMDDQLETWEKEGFVPDVIVCDYMDILADSGNARDDKRHRIDATWRAFRGLLQKWHALGFTATQSDDAGGSTALLTRSNFSESKTKLAHVTGKVGLNQTDDEKELGIFRLNWIVRRGAHFNPKNVCWVAGSMPVQHPCIRSYYYSKKAA